MHYLIDGYNLMFSSGEPKEKTLLEQRESLIEELVHIAEGCNHPITVIFDAHLQYGDPSRTHKKKLEIIYTAFGETADEAILSFIHTSYHPKQHVVVTNDRALARGARESGAKTTTVEAFLKKSSRPLRNYEVKREKQTLPQTPPALKKQRKETEMERWERIFEERLKDNGA